MGRIAFLTCAELDGFISDDELITQQAHHFNLEIEPVTWNSETDWRNYETAVIRTTWDYTSQLGSFLKRLNEIEASGCRLWNPVATVEWNSNKKYLKQLSEEGLSVIPTQFVSPSNPWSSVREQVQAWECEKILVKPAVGASSEGIFVGSVAQLERLTKLRDGEWLIQPFLSAIAEGEISFQFFDKKFSHATLKVPKPGDFRVQEEYGSDILSYPASPAEIEQAQAYVDRVSGPLLYARVDLVPYLGNLALMELELIEPALYFRTDPSSPARFLESLCAFVGRSHKSEAGVAGE